MQEITFRAMGCQMLAALDADTAEAGEALRNVPVWFEIWERTLSRFRPGSELSRLNARTGQWVAVSQTLWDVLHAALRAARHTHGLVIPTALSAMQAIGYTRTFEEMSSERVEVTLTVTPPAHLGDWENIQMDAANRAVWVPPGALLDLGGVAKGWCADQAARRLATYGPALVDAGGDIAIAPAADRATEFPIGIAAPAGHSPTPDALLGTITLRAGGVATSGRDYRRWQTGAREVHHLIDPRTGEPAQTDALTATAIAPTAVQAEAVAKAALLLGSEEGLAWAESQDDTATLLVCEDGRIVHTPNFPLLRSV
ncbi:MAG: FAD:protein FMN transferase [Candidatus Thermofonsia Clade 3 bacterium]|jgi:thiamine biosynthesis lipoprotein|uniref:FAD:protein FMN transferase n=1 Tax=Candidatus Thermofonsia Clade 3 bacterium TaxID=2364212 RepID=A0A2M8QBQ6_9CHLR|nr:FAD:protein FMN transferase [Candidatus Roseilinea sp. NK_OTU-006]PJF47243.1 MAG: FAD:protein FMN transferase [Candidatus Thermofonsia Clade 3 bacterium]